MDVGDPSNFIRVLELFNNNHTELSKYVSSESISDELTFNTIREVYKKYNYILDPHSAVAHRALNNWLEKYPSNKGIILGTAHPVKFPTTVEKSIQAAIPIPSKIETILKKEKNAILIDPNFAAIKEVIIELAN
jgi:threonine synthase